MGNTFVARIYDAGTAEGWKGCVAQAAKPFLPIAPIDLPVRVEILFLMPRPKAHFNSKGLRPEAPQMFTGKPDCDNLAKAVCDALTLLGMWKDDALIWDLKVTKSYDANPGAQIAIHY
jgi:Holliday junction resolvase RusA-like endonuclease